MPTQSTVDRWKRRAIDAELCNDQLARDYDQTVETLTAQRDAVDAERASAVDLATDLRHELDNLDPEARLISDVEAAVARFHERQRRSSGGYVYGVLDSTVTESRPALEDPVGRALLHIAQRHRLAIEATLVHHEPACPSCGRFP